MEIKEKMKKEALWRMKSLKLHEFEAVICNLVNELIFDKERTYSDEEIERLVSIKFKKLFPYI